MHIRKGLIAAATVAAVSFTGVSAVSAEPENQEEQVTDIENGTNDGEGEDQTGETGKGEDQTGETGKGETEKEKEKKNEGSSSSDASPTDIKAWIGVFTAVISALSAAFAFFNRYFK